MLYGHTNLTEEQRDDLLTEVRDTPPTHCEEDGEPIEDGQCSLCGVDHTWQCPFCKRWGFHTKECEESDDDAPPPSRRLEWSER
jgi:hypothetical protein